SGAGDPQRPGPSGSHPVSGANADVAQRGAATAAATGGAESPERTLAGHGRAAEGTGGGAARPECGLSSAAGAGGGSRRRWDAGESLGGRLQVDTHLVHTCLAMVRGGLLHTVGPGRYTVA